MGRADELGKGIGGENPIAVLLIGLCPAAAVSVRVIDALWMSAGVVSCAYCFLLLHVAGGHVGSEVSRSRQRPPECHRVRRPRRTRTRLRRPRRTRTRVRPPLVGRPGALPPA